MAQSTEKIVIVVKADGAEKAGRDIEKVGVKSKKASAEVDRFKMILASVVSIYTLKQFGSLIDHWIELENRIKLSSNSIEGFNKAFKSVQSVANQTRSDINATAMAYNRAAISTEALGLSQRQLENVVRTVNQTLKISGSTAQEARASLIQFFQGLASGQLRGEEFRSVTEANIRLTKLLKDELTGGDLGKLREMAFSGGLTADRVTAAVLRNTYKLDKEFAKISPKIEEVFTKIRNELIIMAGKFNNTYNITGKLLKGFDYLRNNMVLLKAAIIGIAVYSLPLLIGGLATLITMISPLLAMAAVGVMFYKLYENSKVFRMDLAELNKELFTFKTNIGNMLKNTLPGLKKWFDEFDLDTYIIAWQDTFAKLYSFIEFFASSIGSLAGYIVQQMKIMFDSITGTFTALGEGLGKSIFERSQGKNIIKSPMAFGEFLGGVAFDITKGDNAMKNPLDALAKRSKSEMDLYTATIEKNWKDMIKRNEDLEKFFLDKLMRSKLMKDIGRSGAVADNPVIQEEMIFGKNIESLNVIKIPEVLVQKVTWEYPLDEQVLDGFELGFTRFTGSMGKIAGQIADLTETMISNIFRATTDSFLDVTIYGLNALFDITNAKWSDLVKNIGEMFRSLIHDFARDMFHELSKGLLSDLLSKIPGMEGFFGGSEGDKLIRAGKELTTAGITLGMSAVSLAAAASAISLGGLSFGGGEGIGTGTGFLSSLMSGGMFMAEGGSVNANQPYIVGEKRPELFVPRSSGTIVPDLSNIGSGGTTVQNYVVLDSDLPNIMAKSDANKKEIMNQISLNKKQIKSMLGVN